MDQVTWSPDDSASLSAQQVAVDGHHLRLRGEERELAIRLMAARGVPPTEMAKRLCITSGTLHYVAKVAGIVLPRQARAHWTAAYMDREYGRGRGWTNKRHRGNKG